MKTKMTKAQIIEGLKVRLNSVKIENAFVVDDWQSAYISDWECIRFLLNQIKDLEELIELL